MSNLIRHAISIVLFFGIMFAILYYLSNVLEPKDNTKESGMYDTRANGILSEPDNSIDVLFLGDSEVYSSVIPLRIWEETGITSYCCSTPGQQLAYSYEFLCKTLEKQSPKLVFLETGALFRQLNFDDSMLYEAGMLIPAIKYHDRWKTISSEDFNFGNIVYSLTDVNKGYRVKKRVSPASSSRYMQYSERVMPISAINSSYISRINDLCHSKGATLILYSTPSTVNWSWPKHNAVVDLLKDTEIEYIDLNLLKNKVPIDWNSDTCDSGDHLNYYGAMKVTSYFTDYVLRTGLFADHRRDYRYYKWNSNLKEFNQNVKRMDIRIMKMEKKKYLKRDDYYSKMIMQDRNERKRQWFYEKGDERLEDINNRRRERNGRWGKRRFEWPGVHH